MSVLGEKLIPQGTFPDLEDRVKANQGLNAADRNAGQKLTGRGGSEVERFTDCADVNRITYSRPWRNTTPTEITIPIWSGP